MSELLKIVDSTDHTRASVLLVHGLGGHPYDTWRCSIQDKTWDADPTFWPNWLARDCEGLAIYSIGYDAAVSRWRGTAMHPTGQATNILERLLAEPGLARGPLIMIGHSLGGLIIKQMLRTADSFAKHRPAAAELIKRIEKVAFLATPHLGADLTRWGARLRIIVRPSAATACLRRNDPNLRELNYWYRDWANASEADHLILTESQSFRVFGMIVKPDSGDPGLKTRPIEIDCNHISICKPVDAKRDVYVFIRNFITRPTERLKSPSDTLVDQLVAALHAGGYITLRDSDSKTIQQPSSEAKLDGWSDATVTKLIAALDATGVIARAKEVGIERPAILGLARHLAPSDKLDFDQAVKALTADIDTAVDVTEKAARINNFDDLVNSVLARIVEKIRVGDIEGATSEADRGFAEWQRAEVDRQDASARSGIALLEAGVKLDTLRRDAVSAASRIKKIVALEHPNG